MVGLLNVLECGEAGVAYSYVKLEAHDRDRRATGAAPVAHGTAAEPAVVLAQAKLPLVHHRPHIPEERSAAVLARVRLQPLGCLQTQTHVGAQNALAALSTINLFSRQMMSLRTVMHFKNEHQLLTFLLVVLSKFDVIRCPIFTREGIHIRSLVIRVLATVIVLMHTSFLSRVISQQTMTESSPPDRSCCWIPA